MPSSPPSPNSLLPETAPRAGLFITGTDTGVGKTAVAAGLLRLLVRRGHRPTPFKPAETDVQTEPLDARTLRAAAGRLDLPLSLVCPYAFPLPVAPAAAAASAAQTIALPVILSAAERLCGAGDFLLTESAGGLLTPYSHTLTAADIAAALRLPVLLVARNSLGTVNHTALAINELRRRNLTIAGVVLVDTTSDSLPDRATNADLIATTTGVKPLGVLPHVSPATPDALADALQAFLPEALFSLKTPASSRT